MRRNLKKALRKDNITREEYPVNFDRVQRIKREKLNEANKDGGDKELQHNIVGDRAERVPDNLQDS